MREMREGIDEVLLALHAFISDEVAATTMALGGLRTLAHQVVKALEDGIKPEESLLVGVGVPEVGWLLRFDDASAASKYVDQLAPSGATAQRLTRQLIVTIDTAWEEEFRERIARARGLESKSAVTAAFFHDLRRLRNDIVHHRGIATDRNAARCTTLPRRFGAGDPIYLDDRDLLNVKFLIPWDDLAHGLGALPVSRR